MKKRIFVTGSIAYDVLLQYDGSITDRINPDSLDAFSLSLFCPHYARHHGGTGANIAWNISLLGGDPLLVGDIGADGAPYKELLRERGVDTTYVAQHDDAVTATAIICTDNSERQIAFFHPGADTKSTLPDLNNERDDLAYGIVSARGILAMTSTLDWLSSVGVPYLFDPGQQVHGFSDSEAERLVRGAAGVVVNEYEWSLLQKKLNCTEENFLLLCPLLVVTRGEAGVTAFTADGAIDVGACSADQVVNPTGAGDAFRAGLLTGLSSQWSLLDSLRLGCAMGSFAVESEGTLLDSLDRDILCSRVEQTYGEQIPTF